MRNYPPVCLGFIASWLLPSVRRILAISWAGFPTGIPSDTQAVPACETSAQGETKPCAMAHILRVHALRVTDDDRPLGHPRAAVARIRNEAGADDTLENMEGGATPALHGVLLARVANIPRTTLKAFHI